MDEIQVNYGGRIHRFPAGTTQEQISAALAEWEKANPAAQEQPQGGPGLRFRTDITSASPQAPSPPPNPGPVARSAISSGVEGAAAGSPYGLGGTAVGGAIGAGMGAMFPSGDHGNKVGSGLGEGIVAALMNRIVPGANFATRAFGIGAGALAGSEAGAAVDSRVGNEQSSRLSRVLGAIASGAGAALDTKALPVPEPRNAAGDFASALPEYMQRAIKKPEGFLMSFVKGDDEVVTSANQAFNKFVESRGAVLPQDRILNAAKKISDIIDDRNLSRPLTKAEEAIKTAVNIEKPTAKKLLDTMFMVSDDSYDASLAAQTAVTISRYLKQTDPQLASDLKNTFFVRSVVYGSLKDAPEGQKGVVKLLDDATGRLNKLGEVSPLVRGDGTIAQALSPENANYILDGAKFKKHITEMGNNIDLIFGKNSRTALEDVAEVMKLLDPATGLKGFRQQAAAFLGAGLKYNAHRMMFYASQLGAGGGGPEIGSIIKGGIAATAAIGSAIKLDDFAMFAVKNPQAVKTLRWGLETGDAGVVRSAVKALLATSEQPFRDPEQGYVEAMPTTQ